MKSAEVAAGQELLSLEDAAAFLCVSKSTLYRLLEQRKLVGMKAGHQWRFRKADVLAYMQRGPAAQALTKVPTAVLDGEMAVLEAELHKAGTTANACDDPVLVDEAGKITQLVRRMVWLLYTLRGSDIHLNPVWGSEGAAVSLILRVDGALREIRHLPFALLDALVLEWKRQAEIAIEDRQRPLEGSARFRFGDKLVSLRVTTVPTLYGEKVTVRTLATNIPTLAMLGIEQTLLTEWSRKQRGLILFAGPTGSGKSTTMAAFTQEILTQYSGSGGINIMTVEEQVQYIFPQGVTHLKVAQYSTADGIRAVLHHDPDVIVIGELHGDPEVAQLALEAAETGHLVLVCLHARDAMAPLTEWPGWGINRTALGNNLIGIVYQQLAVRLCTTCRIPAQAEPALLARIRQTAAEGGLSLPDDAEFYQYYQQPGCTCCGGRVALHEFITFTPTVRSAFLHSTSIEEFTDSIRMQGQLSFFAAQVQQALAGKISLDTLIRYLP